MKRNHVQREKENIGWLRHIQKDKRVEGEEERKIHSFEKERGDYEIEMDFAGQLTLRKGYIMISKL